MAIAAHAWRSNRWVPFLNSDDGLAAEEPPIIITPPPTSTYIGSPGPDRTSLSRMTRPITDQLLSAPIFLEAVVDPALNATAVKFQVAHPDFGFYAATKTAGTNTWVSTIQYDPAKNPAAGPGLGNATGNDFEVCIRAIITSPTSGNPIYTTYARPFTYTKPAITDNGLTPAYLPILALAPIMTSMTTFYDSFDTKFGHLNNPSTTTALPADNNTAGAASASLVTDTNYRDGKRVHVTMWNNHTTADQPNQNVRWQVQTKQHFIDGVEAWIGFIIRIPTSLNTAYNGGGYPNPQYSHISLHQSIGPTKGMTGTAAFVGGIQYMMHDRVIAGGEGYTDMKSGHHHMNMNEGRFGEPALTWTMPHFRGGDLGIRMHQGYSVDPRKGFWEIETRKGAGAPWVQHEFFGIPGYTRLRCVLARPKSNGQGLHLHVYRGRDKFNEVNVDFGGMWIGPTKESANPFSS